jgi:SAM-dependent methyltransferase
MQHFKPSELAKEYHVSMKTVYNWVDAAKQGKIDLELVEDDGRTYIANKQSNVAVLRQLAQGGKKYRNVRFHKVINPKAEFYDLYKPEQILDIITNLRAHGEIPRQYNYFDRGAHDWDMRMQRDVKQAGISNTLKGTQELIHINLPAIDRLTDGYSKVNVIDIGPGNGMPIRELLEHLLDRGTLHRYVALDISEEMLGIAERNIGEWFGDRIAFEGYVRDITYERFNDLLVDDMLAKDADDVLNLVLILGDLHVNFRDFVDPFRTIYGSMDSKALLLCTTKPDTETSRHYFEFSVNPGENKLASSHTLLFDLFSLTEDLYDVEMDFDIELRMRYVRIRLKTSLTIRFRFKGSVHDVNLEKGSTILVLRVWHLTPVDTINELKRVGLTLLQSSMTKDRNYLLTIFGMEETETKV